MSFRIGKQTALLANGFRTALRGQLARAIKELDISSRIPRAARIHSARRRAKKVRSALRLLKAAAFAGVSQTEHDLLRDVSLEIAPARSAEANMDALKKLCRHTGSDRLRFSRAFAQLEKQKNAVAQGTAASMHKAVTLLKGALSRIDAWNDGSIAWEDVLRGLEHFYKRGRSAFRRAADDASAENLQEWRKRARDIQHGLKLIEAVDSKAARRLARKAKKLCAWLGMEHDLALLQEKLDQCRIGKEKPVLDKMIASRRRALQCKALKLGEKYFSTKPRAFLEKIDR